MKIWKRVTTAMAGLLLFAACQKELSFENPLPNVDAQGSLQSISGDCAPITVKGVYKQDSTLGDSNVVVVQARITSPGKYIISTDVQNGFSFRDSSYITDTGLHNFTLKGTGRPITTQTTDFIVSFNTSICLFSVAVIGNTAAVFTLQGSPTSCSNAVVQGVYQTGTALAAANKVNLQVNVTTLGSYTINTGSNGGMTFSGSGNFANTGLQTVVLQGSGTAPATAGNYTIPVIAGSSNCSFIIPVTAGGGGNIDPNLSDSAWEFSQGTNSYNGFFFDVFDTTRAGVGYGLVFIGFTPATADTAFQLGVLFSGGSIQPGTYNTNSFAGAFYFENIADTSNVRTIYKADPTTLTANTRITISSYDPATGIIVGTFSGTAFNATNTSVPITVGKFRAKVR